MMKSPNNVLVILVASLMVFSMIISNEACRMLDEDAEQLKTTTTKSSRHYHDFHLLQSLQRGSVPPPGRDNGCTFIPGKSKTPCKIDGQGFAGRPSRRSATPAFMHEST